MSRDAVAEVRERTDIVDLVSSYVELKKTGRSLKGLCPFHQEKTPSFVVFPDSGNFHCFGCGRGGDIFTFYMGAENVEFREALQELARRAGVTIDQAQPIAPEIDAHRQKLMDLNELAAAFYANILINSDAGQPGREQVEQRGLSGTVLAKFGLGYAIDGWDALLRYFTVRSIDPEMAVEAGLLQRRDGGGHYDRFRGRLMFPIRDREGRVVGFGARMVGQGEPKYLNSPQTPVFDKSSILYGLDLAKEDIRRLDQVVIVEGYMDVIAAHQFGYTNVVAAMGTAITDSQIGQLKRWSKKIVLALDADAAGHMATVRGLDAMQGALDSDQVPVPDANGVIRFERKLNAHIAIVQLPEGQDPDDLIRANPEHWPKLVDGARPFLQFYIDSVTADLDPTEPRSKSAIVARVAPVLQQVADRIVQAHYVEVLAAKLGLPTSVIMSQVRRVTVRSAVSPLPTPHRSLTVERGARLSNEDHLVAVLLKHRTLCRTVIASVPTDDLLDIRNRELVRMLADPNLPDLPPEQIIAGLDDPVADHAERLLDTLEGTPAQFPGHVEREARQALALVGKERFVFLMRQLHATIQAAQHAGDAQSVENLRAQVGTLADRHRKFYPPPSPYFRDSRDLRTLG